MSGGGVGGRTRSPPTIRTPADVADEGAAAVLVEVARRGARRGPACRRRGSRSTVSPPRQHPQVPRRDGHDLAPQPLHVVAVQALRAGQQLRGVLEVRRAALVHVHDDLRPPSHDRAGRAGVVEVDVREQQRPRGLVSQRLDQRLERGLRPWIDQHVAHPPAADDALAPEMTNVYGLHPAELIPSRPCRYSSPTSTSTSSFRRTSSATTASAPASSSSRDFSPRGCSSARAPG